MTRHRDHDELAATVRAWFLTPQPRLSYGVEPAWFGHVATFGGRLERVILEIDDPSRVGAALDEASRGARGSLSVWVDDPARAARLDDALVRHGCVWNRTIEHLALVGALRSGALNPEVRVRPADAEEREAWASVKLRCFASSEDPPGSVLLAAEVATRALEGDAAQFWFADLGSESAGILAHYPGRDRITYLLGTRVPFRRVGVARTALAAWVRDGDALGCRSHIINARVEGDPAALYRSMGFTDVVHWCRRYDFAPPKGLANED